jgi:hypothetical protein
VARNEQHDVEDEDSGDDHHDSVWVWVDRALPLLAFAAEREDTTQLVTLLLQPPLRTPVRSLRCGCVVLL